MKMAYFLFSKEMKDRKEVFNIAKGQIRQKRDKIDKEQFETLCAMQCIEEEILAVLKISDKTLNTWCKETYDGKNFSEIYAEKRQLGKASLRRMQWDTAKKGNVTMQIWLGKNLLDQRENIEVDNSKTIEKLDEVLKNIGGVI